MLPVIREAADAAEVASFVWRNVADPAYF